MRDAKIVSTAILLFAIVGCSSNSSESENDLDASESENAASVGDNDTTQVTEIDTAGEADSDTEDASPGDQNTDEQAEELEESVPAEDQPETGTDTNTESDTAASTNSETDAEAETVTEQEQEQEAEPEQNIYDDDSNSEPLPNESKNTAPEVSATSTGELQLQLRMLTAQTLQTINQSLSQGELLADGQSECIGGYEPALGNPLMELNCTDPYATGNYQVYINNASFNDTPECRADLTDTGISPENVNCSLDYANFAVHTFWDNPNANGRPTPTVGANITLDLNNNLLRLENREQALSGTFVCEYSLDKGNLMGDTQLGSCNNGPAHISDLINLHVHTAEQFESWTLTIEYK